MFDIKESSDRGRNSLSLWPQHLLCMRCMNGGGSADFMCRHSLSEKLRLIQKEPDIHITLCAAFDEIGARTPLFWEQSPEERKRDLDVLQKLGLVPGDTRTARELFLRTASAIPDAEKICGYDSPYAGAWSECPLARSGFYGQGGALIPPRPDCEMARAKYNSCKEIDAADRIALRPHHLLCIICIIGREHNDIPLPEDNLYEVWMKIRANPDIPILLVEGPGECMICPPCHSYLPDRGLCVAGCNLRDRKKDLDMMCMLGLRPGDSIPAAELIARVYRHLPTVRGLCDYGGVTAPEWAGCGGATNGGYEEGLRKGVLADPDLTARSGGAL